MDGPSTESLSESESGPDVVVKVPEFAPLRESASGGSPTPIERFYEVSVPVWAELGRVQLSIRDLLKLGEGAVIKLSRPVTEPVDLVAQGTVLARGEVVVIDDCFAIRIKEIYTAKKPTGRG